MTEKNEKDNKIEWPVFLKQNVRLKEICDIAERMVANKRYDEAIVMYETALTLFPQSIALKLNLARVRELKRKELQGEFESAQKEWEHERSEKDMLAHHLYSLARIYYEKGYLLKALELLDISKQLNPFLGEVHRLMANIYYDQMHYEWALKYLQDAIRLQPFHPELYHLKARVHLDRKEHEHALESFIDALLLTPPSARKMRELYMDQIRHIAGLLKLDQSLLEDLIRQRQERVNEMVSELFMKKDQIVFSLGPSELDMLLLHLPRLERARQHALRLSILLNEYQPFQMMNDEQKLTLAKESERKVLEPGEVLFEEGVYLEHMYLILSGSIHIVKQTPFGLLRLYEAGEGELLGEMGFIDHMETSAQALAHSETEVLALSRSGLEELMARDTFFGIQLYWYFWKLLADRIRKANTKAQNLFKRALSSEKEEPDRVQREVSTGESVSVDIKKKLDVLREKGLTSSDMKLLATFSQEEKYRMDEVIFREGDPGEELYIILDGKVRISKYIPGVGEEALAILGPGEFFGEMALVDQSPRSADAIAHSAEVTILAIHQRVLHDILSRDPQSSLQFLKILCRMLANRLREINLKIFQWHMMAGLPVDDHISSGSSNGV